MNKFIYFFNVDHPRETIRARQTILKKVNTPPGQHLDTNEDFFLSIIDKKIIDVIVKYTNIEGAKQKPNFTLTDAIEIKAFIGVLLAAGVDRSSKRNYVEFFGVLRGQPIIRATISLKRFKQLLRCIRFDDKTTRTARRAKDKLAPIRDVFEMVNSNLKKMYSPSEYLTVDEQLVPFRGRCSFKQYLPSKPDKYGLKIFWICDAETFYPLNGIPYLGRERSGSERRTGIAQEVVTTLCTPYYR